MKELTRVMTVELTFIGDADKVLSKEESIGNIAAFLEYAGADNVNMTKVQDFIVDKENA